MGPSELTRSTVALTKGDDRADICARLASFVGAVTDTITKVHIPAKARNIRLAVDLGTAKTGG